MEFAHRWLLMLAIATGLFAISLLLLRVNIRTLAILLGIGLPLVTLWLHWMLSILVRNEEIVHQNRLVYALSVNTRIQERVLRRNVHAA